MKNILLLTIITSLFIFSCKSDKKEVKTNKEETKTVVKKEFKRAFGSTHIADIAASKVLWKAYKPTGSNNGSILIKNGEITIEEGNLTFSSVPDIPVAPHI